MNEAPRKAVKNASTFFSGMKFDKQPLNAD